MIYAFYFVTILFIADLNLMSCVKKRKLTFSEQVL